MRKKMIEVAIPLDAINKESAREKSIRHGHPSTLHLWWARRPLAACRAVLFTSLVDDPDSDPANHAPDGTVDTAKAQARRRELFGLIEELVQWDNTRNESVLNRARAEIASSYASYKVHDAKEWTLEMPVSGETVKAFVTRTAAPLNVNRFLADHLPAVHDPFAGGGSIPLEAQRLGLRVYATDLNPVPVLINKSLIDLPRQFSGNPPINPDSRREHLPTKGKAKQKTLATKEWQSSDGLAADVRFYGRWMRDEAEQKIGHLYPQVLITDAMARERPDLVPYVGESLTVIAWLWARTVPSPNPVANGSAVPLLRSFVISTKKGKEAWVEPLISLDGRGYRFVVRIGKHTNASQANRGTVVRTGATCLLTGQPIPFDFIRQEGKAGRMATRMMAIVCETKRGRIYLSPTSDQEKVASQLAPTDVPDTMLPEQALGFRVQLYGMDGHAKLFTPRQLTALSTFSTLVRVAHAKVFRDAEVAGVSNPQAYADAVATYLAFSVSKASTRNCTQTTWYRERDSTMAGFSRQAIAMTWDFAEVNPLLEATGSLASTASWVAECLEEAIPRVAEAGEVAQHDAAQPFPSRQVVCCTDPPYYDNIGYADLSDFFYVWLRRSLKDIYPALFSTVLTPKTEELIATPYRHDGSREKANTFFEKGLGKAFVNMRQEQHVAYPMTVFYAFKQSESQEAEDEDEGGGSTSTASTGWETMLEGLISAGLAVTGTWPMRTEQPHGLRVIDANALASSVVLACHPRAADAPLTTRRDFVAALKRELPAALRELQAGNIAPVDLAQAAIGPGMAVYSRYSRVLESSGERLTIRTALALINQVLDEVLAEQEGDYDADTRWSLKWFEQFAHDDGPFGDANTLATAMSIGINGLVETGIVQAKAGKVRLLKRTELMNGRPETWDPATDTDIVHWEVCQYLIHALDTKGEAGAAALLRRINARYPGAAETARELAYHLYTICERKKWAQEAMAYNSLIVAWPEIVKLAQSSDGSGGEAQTTMF